ncbi:MAG: hypothetical protein HRT86_05510 [Ilumatobacteraceae bacterium]|nr:hypothetical protein [Ilumatobacteraceae bacterium]
MTALFDLSRDWYAGRLDINFEPRTLAESQALLTARGFDGPFWQLT